jgi:hypothetical protein
MNAYFKFLEEKIEGVKKANPTKAYKEQVAIVANMYNDLDDKKKQVYVDAYNKEKDKYNQQLKEYEAKHGKI